MGGGEALFSLLFSKPDGGTRSWDPWVSREEKTRSGIKRPAESPGAASQDRAPERCWETGVEGVSRLDRTWTGLNRTGTSHWMSLIWPPLPAFQTHGWLGHLSQEVYRTGTDQAGNRGARLERKLASPFLPQDPSTPKSLTVPDGRGGRNEGPRGSFQFRLGPSSGAVPLGLFA